MHPLHARLATEYFGTDLDLRQGILQPTPGRVEPVLQACIAMRPLFQRCAQAAVLLSMLLLHILHAQNLSLLACFCVSA